MPEHFDLLEAIGASDTTGALKLFRAKIASGEDPCSIHDSLFPVVQLVTHQPFITPHLPKMYRIERELASFLGKERLPALVQLEINEYARRVKMKPLDKPSLHDLTASFEDVQRAIQNRDVALTAVLLSKMYSADRENLARQMLVLGSGYLGESLGHSVSCTAFMLLEILDRIDQDPWPSLVTIADFFCKSGYDTVQNPPIPVEVAAKASAGDMLRAVSGLGLVNLHHTIIRYAIERIRHLLSPLEYAHMIDSWLSFMGDKDAEPFLLKGGESRKPADYEGFFRIFSKLEAEPVVASLSSLLDTPNDRRRIGEYVVRGICDLYQGDYNPHYLTGLASALWVVQRYGGGGHTAATALRQFLDYYFEHLSSK
jgi:hypothetical protein